ALHDTNAEPGERCGQLLCTLHVDRLNADAVGLEMVMHGLWRQSEACPVSVDHAGGGGRVRQKISAVEEPHQGFANLVRRKTPSQSANELADGPAAVSDCGGQRTIELAIEEELAVLRIEADRIGRQQIDGEIWRETWNVPVVESGGIPAITRPHGG